MRLTLILAVAFWTLMAMVAVPVIYTARQSPPVHTEYPQPNCFADGVQGVEGFFMCPDASRLKMEKT